MNTPPRQGPADQGWYYHRAGNDYGPMDRQDLAEALRLIPLDDVSIWHPNFPGWIASFEPNFRSLVFGATILQTHRMGVLALLFSFRGRIGRAKFFWWSCLVVTPYVIAVMTILGATHTPVTSQDSVLFRLALAPPFVWMGLALTAKRLHDLGRSAKHLFWIVPVIWAPNVAASPAALLMTSFASLVIELWLLFRHGTAGANRFGSGFVPANPTGAPVPPSRGGSTSKYVAIALALLVLAGGILVAQEGKILQVGAASKLTCSQPEVLAKVVEVAKKNQNNPFFSDKNGLDKLVISLHGVRTIDDRLPPNGRTCVAIAHISSTDPVISSVIGNKDVGDITYSVQLTDENNGKLVVTVLSD